MKVRILHPAGPWGVGEHEVPDRQARNLIRTGYAEPVDAEGQKADRPAEPSPHSGRGKREARK